MISLIWAMSRNRVIGRDNELPWRLPDELQYFKEQTLEKPVIMGRKTYESISSPLPNRLNIVLTRKKQILKNVIVVNSLKAALDRAKQYCESNAIEECFVIGGSSVYAEALPHAQRLYATTVNAEIQGDAYFPKYDESRWTLVNETHHPMDSEHAYSYDIRRYERAS
ncbi:MAG: dihydrofolate reductase [Gammaproteobacteria bacterium]|nr:dihydrofolate reductase [Gammaproteobacteria bacterium]